jgi:hypothetical protein
MTTTTKRRRTQLGMLLTDFVDRYITAKNALRDVGRELSPATRDYLIDCIAVLSRHLGRPAKVRDLTPKTLNALLEAETAAGRSPYTVKNRRTGLLALWREAKCAGLTAVAAEGVRRVHCPKLDIKGYSDADMEKLVETAFAKCGRVRGTDVSRSTYWVSLLLAMWDLGLRAGDMLTIQVLHLDATGRLWVSEHKTSKSGWHQLRPTTLAAIKACIAENPSRERIWPGFRPRSLYRAFTRLAEAAGLPGTTSRWTRRGSGSAVERENPGSGWRFLNHSTPSVFENHYRDSAICDDALVAPPEVKLSPMLRDIIHGEPMAAEPPGPVEAPQEVSPTTPQKASDVSLTDEARKALLTFKLTTEELGALVDCLAAQGVSQRQLAEWWGVKFKFYQNMRYGYKRIPTSRAAKLRRLFGVKREGAPKKFEPLILDSFTIVA